MIIAYLFLDYILYYAIIVKATIYLIIYILFDKHEIAFSNPIWDRSKKRCKEQRSKK